MSYSHRHWPANHHWSVLGKGLLIRYLRHKKPLEDGPACSWSWQGPYQYLLEISHYCQNLPPDQEFIFKSLSVESNSQHTKKRPSCDACKECWRPQPGKHQIPLLIKISPAALQHNPWIYLQHTQWRNFLDTAWPLWNAEQGSSFQGGRGEWNLYNEF